MTAHWDLTEAAGEARRSREVERFNEQYPVGTPVRYWPGARHGDGRESRTRTPAWLVGGHTPCVSVEGYPGGIALTHIDTALLSKRPTEG